MFMLLVIQNSTINLLFANYTNIIILNIPISFSVKHNSTTKEKGVD